MAFLYSYFSPKIPNDHFWGFKSLQSFGANSCVLPHCRCGFVLLQLSDVFYLTCTVNTCQTPEVVSSNKPLDLHN